MLNKNSNSYIITYTVILTFVCASLLYIVAEVLRPYQEENVALDKKKNILQTVMEIDKTWDKNKINSVYNDRVKSYVINSKGEVIEGENADKVDIDKEAKVKLEDRKFPVYEIKSENDKNKVEYYVISTTGKGLWDKIGSFIALNSDLETIKGIMFSHKAETPGLGARIKDDKAVYSRYAGKSIMEKGEIVPVIMMKGEGNDYSNNNHAVDGMSGATKTAEGVNDMLKDYLTSYSNFIKSKKSKN